MSVGDVLVAAREEAENRSEARGYARAVGEIRDKLCAWDDEPGRATDRGVRSSERFRLSLEVHGWLDEMEAS